MKIFISQPMKGLTEDEIRANRQEVVELLTGEGHEIVDSVFSDMPSIDRLPASVRGDRQGLWCLGKALQLITEKADAVYFMNGWDRARGCMMEHDACRAYSILTMYQVPDVPTAESLGIDL